MNTAFKMGREKPIDSFDSKYGKARGLPPVKFVSGKIFCFSADVTRQRAYFAPARRVRKEPPGPCGKPSERRTYDAPARAGIAFCSARSSLKVTSESFGNRLKVRRLKVYV